MTVGWIVYITAACAFLWAAVRMAEAHRDARLAEQRAYATAALAAGLTPQQVASAVDAEMARHHPYLARMVRY